MIDSIFSSKIFSSISRILFLFSSSCVFCFLIMLRRVAFFSLRIASIFIRISAGRFISSLRRKRFGRYPSCSHLTFLRSKVLDRLRQKLHCDALFAMKIRHYDYASISSHSRDIQRMYCHESRIPSRIHDKLAFHSRVKLYFLDLEKT